MLHLQFWDGALLPAAVLRWHLLTCKFFTPSHLQIFMQFWDDTVWSCQIHRKKNNQMESWRFCHNVYTSPVENAKFTENKNAQRNRGINLWKKMQSSPKTKMINAIMLQIFRKKCDSQQKQKRSMESCYKSFVKNAKVNKNKNDQSSQKITCKPHSKAPRCH